ncbi:MAG: Abi family protein [Bacteroidetes bacterium]|nr:Abi family protein [Bacteroidota bacterium]
MQVAELEKLLSQSRLATYYQLFPNDKQIAIEYYQLNTQIAESLYPLLSNLEIVLRNTIHNSFSIHFKNSNWYTLVNYPELQDQINIAKSKITASKNQITIDKLVSELTFGFWTSLFNKNYAKDYWKPLMYAFPLLDKQQKHRNLIAFKLNNIRKFRNRIFHYEPICNDLNILSINHANILEILQAINTDIVLWTKQIDRFDILFKQANLLRTTKTTQNI